jgi:ParB-like chromosome segregation protein Spo0J
MKRRPSKVVETIWPLAAIHPAPENSDIYCAIAVDDPSTIELARSIMEHGVQEPILISQNG